MSQPAKPATPAVQHVEVDAAHEGQRLDNFLIAALKGVPRSHVYRILRTGQVRVNRGRARPDYRLKRGDRVRLPPLRHGPAPAPAQPAPWLEGRVLYEDEALLVIDKPAGLAVHGGSGVQGGLIERLRATRTQAPMLELVHRLDRETSGCLLVAKDRKTLAALHRQWRTGAVEKTYYGLVRGRLRGRREVAATLGSHRLRAGERRVEVVADGKAAASRLTARRQFPQATLVEIALLTGRMHQARVHAAHLGHPLAGDDKYGDREFNRRLRELGLRRLFLHAARLSFVHPRRGSKIVVDAPLPAELGTVLERLAA